MSRIIGEKFTVIIDRPIGSTHPDNDDVVYEVNYGYIEGIIAPDGEEQDAYVLGVDEPIEEFTGTLIAIIHRLNDVENKWVISNKKYSKEEIYEQVKFVEKYFKVEILD
jgi:inorganic pyrophosphatase